MTLDPEKLVKNELLTLAGRVAILVASACMPIVGTILWQVWSAAANISAKVDTQGVQIELLKQTVQFGLDANKSEVSTIRSQVTDHEGRIRVIERDTGRLSRPN